MEILVSLCARAGSKGIPGKNFKLLNNIPLIAYSIKAAQALQKTHHVDIGLTTDSEDIKKIAADWGLNTAYQRSEELSTDKVGKIDTIKDLMLWEEKQRNKKYDYILDLDITSPLRTVEDLTEALGLIENKPQALDIFSVSPPNRNPYFNMVEPAENDYVKLVKNAGIIKSRQTAPPVFDMNASFIYFRRRFFDEGWQVALTDKSMMYLVPHACFDLDHTIDFTVMEIILREKLIDFEFDYSLNKN